MSLLRKETIECPHCHQGGVFDFWESVNVDINPELKEKIFSDELFLYHCPHCGKVKGIPASTLYHDMTHRFMIYFKFFKPNDYDYTPMEIPEYAGLNKEYIFRAAFGLQRFKEKIVILEHELNDVAIEHQKYMISHVIMPEIAEKGYELFFAKTEEPNEKFPNGTIYFFYNDEEKEQTIQIRFAMDSYFEHKLACELDPRMKAEGCMCVDAEWIARQLKEE